MNLCLSISTADRKQREQLINNEPFVELRCDLMGATLGEVSEMAEKAERVIVTCHSGAEREAIYCRAIEARAWAIDLAHDLPKEVLGRLIDKAKEQGVRVIISRHYDTTPTREVLICDAEEALSKGADIAKIITTAHTTAEALTPLALYEHFVRGQIVAFAMGEKGRFSRRLSLLLGAPYTYIAPSSEQATAVGQPTREWLEGSMECPHDLAGLRLPDAITPPSSKSEAQRAVLLATLAEGTTTFRNYTPCDDTEAAVALARALGASISTENNTLFISGIGAKNIIIPTTLSVGESALLARLTLPLVATLGDGEATVSGTGTLLGRSMRGDLEALSASGTPHTSEGEKLPITVGGQSAPLHILELDGSHSSQTISGWMIALGALGGDYEIRVRGAVSRPYTALTARMMSHFGAQVEIGETTDIQNITIHSEGYKACSELSLTGDWSSAGYWAVAYAIAQSGAHKAERYTLHIATSTTQADERIVEILRSAGANIVVGEGKVEFLPSPALRATEVDATDAPDLIPTLAVLALYATGTSRIAGLRRLATKESDRTEALAEALIAMGARIDIEGDVLTIEGPARLHTAPLRTHADHRIAMALTICGLFMTEPPRLDNVACVAKSYPTFFDELKR